MDGLHTAHSKYLLDLHGEFHKKGWCEHDPILTLFWFAPMEKAPSDAAIDDLNLSPFIPHRLTHPRPHGYHFTWIYDSTLYI